jgi:predicted phage terminase large subunit-like protein
MMIAEDERGGKRVAIAAPRGHGKSTILSLLFPLWSAVFLKKRFIVLVSDTRDQANLNLAALSCELTENRRLRADFGELSGRKWTEGEILLANGVRIIARGTGSKLRGLRSFESRPDLIICDDLENDEHVESREQREKIHRWFTRALINTMDPEGDLVVIGTLIHHDSLLARFLKKEDWGHRVFKAFDEDGKPLWGSRFSRERLLQRKKEIGSLAFSSEFMNEPIPPEARVFPEEKIRYYRPEEISSLSLDIYGAVDPAISERRGADYSAIVTIGVDEAGRVFVLDADIGRYSPTRLVERIFFSYLRFHHLVIGVEAISFQELLCRIIEDEARRRRLFLPLKSIGVRGEKRRRILRLSPLIERGTILFSPQARLLIEQLIEFPAGAHDDGPDALEMAVSLAREGRGFFEQVSEPEHPGEIELW